MSGPGRFLACKRRRSAPSCGLSTACWPTSSPSSSFSSRRGASGSAIWLRTPVLFGPELCRLTCAGSCESVAGKVGDGADDVREDPRSRAVFTGADRETGGEDRLGVVVVAGPVDPDLPVVHRADVAQSAQRQLGPVGAGGL